MPKITNHHLIDVDIQSGNEYQMGDVAGYVSDPYYFFERASEVSRIVKYSQLEFAPPRTLCTLYGSMNALGTRVGRDFTTAEREELVTLRRSAYDFDDALGGYTSVGVDIVRKWWNVHNPENPVVSFAIDVRNELGRKFYAKQFPLVTSLRGSASYSSDHLDGVLNETSWGKTTYGHCRMRVGETFHDNYDPRGVWTVYKYPNLDRYLTGVENGYDRPIAYAYFLEKELSGDGKILVGAMKIGLWNGERENEAISRWEASRIAIRIAMGKVPESKIWNGKDGNKPASKYEVSVMFSRANKNVKLYTDTDRNQDMSRRETILYLHYGTKSL